MNTKHCFKTFIILILFQMFHGKTSAQNRLYGNAALEWANKQEGEKPARLLLLYDKSSAELSAEVALSPLIENSEQRDSASRDFAPFVLKLQGVLPYNQPEFFSAADNEKQLSMDVKIQIGDSIENRRMTLILTMLQDNKNNNTPGGLNTSILPCHANFVLAIDPIRFGLHKSGLKWRQKFTVEVENGIINKK
jgi:hypothetical protein